MKTVEIKIIKKSISLILDEFIKELNKLNEPTEIHLITNLKWGVSRIRTKNGIFRDTVKKSKNINDEYGEKLDYILMSLTTGKHTLFDCYVDEKPSKEKWYAVKLGKNNIQNVIYTTWDECKNATHGYNSVFKSFDTREEAEEYLLTVDVNKVLAQKAYCLEQKLKKN